MERAERLVKMRRLRVRAVMMMRARMMATREQPRRKKRRNYGDIKCSEKKKAFKVTSCRSKNRISAIRIRDA